MTTQPTTRQIFRDAIRRLDPAKPVAGGDESTWYVPSDHGQGRVLCSRFSLNSRAKVALVGPIGTGKTTELLRLRDTLNLEPDTQCIYVDATRLGFAGRFSASSIAAEVVRELWHQMPEFGWSGEQEQLFQFAADRLLHGVTIHHRLVPERGVIPGMTSTYVPGALVETAELDEYAKSALTEAARFTVHERGLGLVIMLDGLDRVPRGSDFLRCLLPFVNHLSQLGVGYCVVGPLSAAYGEARVELADIFEAFESTSPVLPEARHEFFCDLLQRREVIQLFTPLSLDVLSHDSGGNVRDMVQLCRESIQQAYAAGASSVEKSHAHAASAALGRSMMIGVLDDEYAVLERAARTKNFTPRTSTDLNLIATKRLIEVREGLRTRYEVHPALLPFIVQEQAS